MKTKIWTFLLIPFFMICVITSLGSCSSDDDDSDDPLIVGTWDCTTVQVANLEYTLVFNKDKTGTEIITWKSNTTQTKHFEYDYNPKENTLVCKGFEYSTYFVLENGKKYTVGVTKTNLLIEAKTSENQIIQIRFKRR